MRADPPSYRAAYAALAEAIRQRRGLIVLLGGAGVGETLLVREMLEALRADVRAIAVPYAASFEDVVRFVGEQLGFDAKGGALELRLAAVQTLIRLETQAGANIVLVVEDAHLLPAHVVAALSRLLVPSDTGGFAAQILCVGHPALDAMLPTTDGVRVRLKREQPEAAAPVLRVKPIVREPVRHRAALPLGVAATMILAVAVARHVPRDLPVDAAGIERDRPQAPSAEETLRLVDACRRAYEARDLSRVRELLAPAKPRGGEIVALPAGARDVLYLQPLSRVVPRGATTELRGPFVVRYRDGSGRVAELRGTAVWRVARRDGVVRIIDVVHHVASRERPPRQRAGNSIRMRVPRPRSLSMSSRPPWRSTTERAIAIPRPVPFDLVV